MVAMLAFGGTYAYFTATAYGASNSTRTALIKLASDRDSNETITIKTQNVLPGEYIVQDAPIVLTDSSTRDTYVFATVSVTFGGTPVDLASTAEGRELIYTLAKATAEDAWKTDNGLTAANSLVYYYDVAHASANTPATLTFDMDLQLNPDLEENYDQADHGTANAGDATRQYMNKEVVVTISFCACQKDGDGMNLATAYSTAVAKLA